MGGKARSVSEPLSFIPKDGALLLLHPAFLFSVSVSRFASLCFASLGAQVSSSSSSSSSNNQHTKVGALEILGMGEDAVNGTGRCWISMSGFNVSGTADERAACFDGLQKPTGALCSDGACGKQASTLLELMTIRTYHSKSLRQCGLGTAIGFRTRNGELTSTPAIIVFVARKVHTQWLHEMQILPSSVEGPGGIWCDVDVVEFSYFGVPATVAKEQMFSKVLDGLRGMDAAIGSGTQVASQETYGTLGALVQSQIGLRELGFITNRHVAVDLDFPCQKMFHPLPPNLGPGVPLGSVNRATSFVKDDLWYGIFAGVNPETFVRADGAFIPFAETFDISKVTTSIKEVGCVGKVYKVDLQAQIGSIVGRQVVKVGRSSGCTKGTIMGYAVEYNDENGFCFLTDFLIVGENKKSFDLEGDSGSLILIADDNDAHKLQPVGLIWGGTANCGRLKLRTDNGPENWTSGVDLGRLLDILQLDIITTEKELHDAIMLQGRLGAPAKPSGSPTWLEPPPPPAKQKIPLPMPPTPEEPEQEVMNLLSSSSIGNLPHRHDDARPSLDLANEDLSMRLAGPSVGTLVPHHPPINGPGSLVQARANQDAEEVQESSLSRGTKARKL